MSATERLNTALAVRYKIERQLGQGGTLLYIDQGGTPRTAGIVWILGWLQLVHMMTTEAR